MSSIRYSFLVLFFAVLPEFVFADVLWEEKRVFGGPSCTPKPACLQDPAIPNLKEYGFWVRSINVPPNVKFSDDLDLYWSKLYAWYETEQPAHIEDFAFVQYVRGCIYSTERHPDGRITTHFNVTHWNLGERKVFVHPDWIVDSEYLDPFMSTNPKFPLRHYFMESQKKPDEFPRGHGAYYGDSPPKLPRLSVMYSPSVPASASNSSEDFARNHSLEYRTCLYRTKDIPAMSDGANIPGAIGCFDWSSSYVYDHARKKYASPAGENPVCRPEKIPDFKGPW